MNALINQNAQLVASEIDDCMTPMVTITEGFQNIVETITVNPSKKYSDLGGGLQKEYRLSTFVAEGTPAEWATADGAKELPVSVCPIGSTVIQLTVTAGVVTAAAPYFRVAGAGAAADFKLMTYNP